MYRTPELLGKKTSVTDENQVKDICDLARRHAGLLEGQISSKSRRSELQLPRAIVGVVAREYGIHYNSIAKILNRDRCSVYYYEKKHAENYAYWTEYRDLFNRVYNSYGDIKGSKKSFESNEQLKNHLTYSGVHDNLIENKVNIEVRSGKYNTIIHTNYKDFSNTLKRISECLVDYNHKLDVQI